MWQPYPEAATSLRTRQEIEVGDLNCHADHPAGTPLDAQQRAQQATFSASDNVTSAGNSTMRSAESHSANSLGCRNTKAPPELTSRVTPRISVRGSLRRRTETGKDIMKRRLLRLSKSTMAKSGFAC